MSQEFIITGIISILAAIASAFFTAYFGTKAAINKNRDELISNNKYQHLNMSNEIKRLEARHEKDTQRFEDKFCSLIELFNAKFEAVESKLSDLKQEIALLRKRYERDI